MELEEAIKVLQAQLDTKTEKGYYKPMAEEETRVVLNHLTKQEKIIKLMVNLINTNEDPFEWCRENGKCEDELISCGEYIKQYFEKKAEE
jgi:hypothetical protein